ncbi:SufB/SufD family protein [Anaerococcus degeneri]|uniref:SufD family Fe-S cluster assembly protein n=1 Tax=Anaerococcus degeneri TaxID=361500 RepID=A0ABS7YXG7_9FIRM|nr:SufD family Fe-S cluster assembly protein [Anaerococcus degeneri]MBP2015767.1 Fe-S cluster assembly scaffold protein SufB [Anaerococcus degeneri]MCA2096125.1 SufD family Fe-S cluster assembly protein [Anaerococcus degeneri]
MARINEMRAPTWAYLGLNKADYDLVELKNQPFYGNSVKEGQSQVQNAFEGETYGLSPEINKENSDFRNHFLSFDIDKNRETEFINLEINDENNILVSSIEINARENTSSSFLVNFADLGQGKIFVNSQILVNLEKDSKVKLVVVVDLKNESTNLNSIATRLSDRADLDVTYIEIGATKSMVNIRNILRGEEAKVVENGVYFKSKEEYLDLMTVNEHFGINTDSNTLFNGALKDKAVKNFKGIVDLRRGCTKADGKIGDYSMMLSDKVVNKSAPILLNEEREVAGKHAASVGRMNKEMLFYIMSRGFSKKQAESMMLEANFAPALDKIEDEDLRKTIADEVHELNSRN